MKNAKSFLKKFPGHTLMLLDDKIATGAEPLRKTPLSWHAKTFQEEDISKLKKPNGEGAGVFFTPNKYPDGTRKGAECEGVNAWYMEIDDVPKEEQLKRIKAAPIYPSMIVETGKSYHCYWMAENGTIENFKKITKGLVAHFKSDPAVADIARVLRVPGFYHNKKEPVMVGLVYETEEKWLEEDMLEAYPYEEKTYKPKAQKQIDGKNVWDIMTRWDNLAMLEALSGDSIVNMESYTFSPRKGSGGFIINVDGSPSNAWIDENGAIGGPCAPNWVHWLSNAEYFNRSKKDILDWTTENCDHLLPENLKKKKLWTPKGSKPVKKPKKFIPYTWGTENMDKTIWALKRHEVLCLAGVTNSGKTAYAYYLARKNAELGHKVCYIVLEMSGDEIADRAAAEFADFTIEEDRLEQYPEDKKSVYEEKRGELMGLKNLTMMDAVSTPIEELYGKMLELGDFDLVVIDNFDRIKKSDGIDSDYESDNHKIQMILDFTKIHQVPQVLVHHINSKRKGGSGGYSLTDLRGSGKIPDECNTVFYVSRDCNSDISVQDKAKFFIQAKKHRRKGQLESKCLYFRDAGFYDNYTGPSSKDDPVDAQPWQGQAYWQN